MRAMVGAGRVVLLCESCGRGREGGVAVWGFIGDGVETGMCVCGIQVFVCALQVCIESEPR